MALFNFLKNNSRLLIWAFVGLMVFWGWNQSQERKLDAQRIATLETTVAQMSSTVTQMALTMQQTAELMQKFNSMASDWEARKGEISNDASRDRQANQNDLQKTDVGTMRIPDSVINRLRESADAARNAANSANVSANAAKPDN